MGPQLDMFNSCSLQEGAEGTPKDPETPGPSGVNRQKTKPMSKKLSTFISQCSAKMTEILSWQAKLDENKSGLILVGTDFFSCVTPRFVLIHLFVPG